MANYLDSSGLQSVWNKVKDRIDSSVSTLRSEKQDKLTAQTAYSAKGTATKVPQITTNTLGQVTKIEEVTITQPTVNNATLTIQKNGTNVNTFTANASSDVTANITVPTKVSELTNDSGFTTNTGTVTGIKMNGASKGTSGVVDLGTVITDISGKQDKLSTQTAYTSKGSATKVPQITTNTLGQVTGITEVTIAPDSSSVSYSGSLPSSNVYAAIENLATYKATKSEVTSQLSGKQDSLSADQLAAANSGIDASKVSEISSTIYLYRDPGMDPEYYDATGKTDNNDAVFSGLSAGTISKCFLHIRDLSQSSYADVYVLAYVDDSYNYVFYHIVGDYVEIFTINCEDERTYSFKQYNINNCISITYDTLKATKNGSSLVPGMQYRITDYACTTTTANTQSAGHAFDIIVTADSANKLNENARACLHAGDTYFSSCKLESWELKYCIDNDTDRFAWASLSGKGVIYYMKDEWNNECPYDFKNIQFKNASKYNYFAYTFNWYNDDSTNTCEDLSVNQTAHTNDEGGYTYTHGNIIKPYGYKDDGVNYGYPQQLNFIVFTSKETDVSDFMGYEDNTFDFDCHDIMLTNECCYNSFGKYCNSIRLYSSCYCNSFGVGCNNDVLYSYCVHNVFGNDCSNDTLTISCQDNTFESMCTNISVTVSSGLMGSIFEYGCSGISINTSCHQLKVGAYNHYINVNGSGNYGTTILKGVNGSASYITISLAASTATTGELTVAKDSSGNIRQFNMADFYTQLAGVESALATING